MWKFMKGKFMTVKGKFHTALLAVLDLTGTSGTTWGQATLYYERRT